MTANGTNSWHVSFAHISWFERLLTSHSNIRAVSRHDDLVFEVQRVHQKDQLSVVCLNEYTMGLTAIQRVIQEFGKPHIIYIGGGWCGYTAQAKEFCSNEHIGLYVTDEMSGALWSNEYWSYCKRDKDGHPIHHISRERA
jgi:hypothetical protein